MTKTSISSLRCMWHPQLKCTPPRLIVAWQASSSMLSQSACTGIWTRSCTGHHCLRTPSRLHPEASQARDCPSLPDNKHLSTGAAEGAGGCHAGGEGQRQVGRRAWQVSNTSQVAHCGNGQLRRYCLSLCAIKATFEHMRAESNLKLCEC